ncbi:cellulase family glycosylhydrolase [Rhodococcoides yunnanense]|uniref:Cellulase family glycosylhydrolase n=1 Tax=Rhodococcoides yunnanense TaxID=278209 RepID=A0ABU4B793_9NOCA|nr:cellulase family glycosylhydrolase [Rhodococcus yunnanensis]MDV6260053.1 cellulase family glycosylhydrolase [Rhodococcus yunnanensis]
MQAARRRRCRIFSASIAVALMLSSACSSAEDPADDQVESTSIAAAEAGGCQPSVGELGLTAVTASESKDLLVKQSSLISQYGFGAVRLTIHWPVIEPYPNVYDWTSTDEQVAAFSDAGLDILGVATWAPWWDVDPANRNVMHPKPSDPERFSEFAKLVANRYKDRIRTWEIWNEPNTGATFGPSVDLQTYIPMLKQSYQKIKSIDPDIEVLTGGTSPTIDNDTDLSPASFVKGLYAAGAGPFFDAIAMHPYSAPDRLSEASAQSYSSNTAIARIRETMVVNGDRNKKIWFTEFGAASGTGPESVTEDKQAELLVDGIDYLRSLSYCGGIFLFDFRDIDSGNSVDELNAGLVRSDFSPKPALDAVIQAGGSN